ncbi:MAG TPA: sugar transferase, partial [Bacteroidota bacterium]|nr:sugar transferase [Bacteroidota bacterium]
NRLSNRFFKRLLDLVGGCFLYATLYLFSGPPSGTGSGAGSQPGNKRPRLILRRRLGSLPAVLRGRMSLVGPTGCGDAVNPAVSSDAYLGKPGLTSLADLNTKDDLSVEERERYDVYYAKNQSIVLDLEILMNSLRTDK